MGVRYRAVLVGCSVERRRVTLPIQNRDDDILRRLDEALASAESSR